MSSMLTASLKQDRKRFLVLCDMQNDMKRVTVVLAVVFVLVLVVVSLVLFHVWQQ